MGSIRVLDDGRDELPATKKNVLDGATMSPCEAQRSGREAVGMVAYERPRQLCIVIHPKPVSLVGQTDD